MLLQIKNPKITALPDFVTHYIITRNVYQIGRLSHDLAGGFLATMPDEKALENPEVGDLVRKYHTANPDYEVDERIKLSRYIENMTSVTTLVEAMHGAG